MAEKLVPTKVEDLSPKEIPITELHLHTLDDKISVLKRLRPKYYQVITISLTGARTKEQMDVVGDYIYVEAVTGAVSVILNEVDNDSIDFAVVKHIRTPIYRIFITNTAQAGLVLTFVVGRNGLFEATR